jgi:hypothetical protein
MRLAILCLAFATAASAQLTSGTVVRTGVPFPVVADVNGDGLDDLIQEKDILINRGAAFEEQKVTLRQNERIFGEADVNGDGVPDLLTIDQGIAAPPAVNYGSGPGQPVYRLYIGSAAHTYAKSIDVAMGPRPYVADVDADGKDDLVIFVPVRPDGIREIGMDVAVLRSRGDGTFESLPSFRIPTDPQIYPEPRIQIGDLDHDGLPDLVMRCTEDLVILHGLGGGRFAVETHYMPLNDEFGGWSLRLADVDGDGNLDIAVAAWRSIRVFLGDGHGHFPRVTKAAIPKLHDGDYWPGVTADDHTNQPRDLAIGHFTRGDRDQIAAGTLEGDLVVFGWEQGALKEVSRTRTEFWGLDIRSGSFHGKGALDDLYVMGTLIWGEPFPRPRLFNGVEGAATTNVPSRRRAAGRTPVLPGALRIQISGECIDGSGDLWSFTRDGIFGRSERGDTAIDAAFDGEQIYFRLTAPFMTDAARGVLTGANGSYSGTAPVLTTCGWKAMNITATTE